MGPGSQRALSSFLVLTLCLQPPQKWSHTTCNSSSYEAAGHARETCTAMCEGGALQHVQHPLPASHHHSIFLSQSVSKRRVCKRLWMFLFSRCATLARPILIPAALTVWTAFAWPFRVATECCKPRISNCVGKMVCKDLQVSSQTNT